MLVRFDLSQFDKKTVINSAKLELYVEAQPRTGAATANLYRASKEWVENEATWFKASESDWWDKEGGDFGPEVEASSEIPSNAVNKWEGFDVTSLVQDFVENPGSNYGFHLYMSVTMVTVEYVSSESGKTDKRPKLTLDLSTGIYNDVVVSKKQIRLRQTSGSYSIYLPFSGSSVVGIYDVKGKELTTFTSLKSNNWYKIPGSIKPGTHIVRISNQGKNIVKRLLFVK